MSTEKSLLTYESIARSLKSNRSKYGVQIPVGVSQDGKMCIFELEPNKSTAHMLLCGLCGSGKSKAVQFIIKGLFDMYGSDLGISYIDGKSYELAAYKHMLRTSKRTALPCLMSLCETVEELEFLLSTVLKYVNDKSNNTREILVLEEISHLLVQDTPTLGKLLMELARLGSQKNLHILFTTQRCSLDDYKVLNTLIDFDLVCATRVHEEESHYLFGTNIASREGGTRKYGDLTFRYKNIVQRVTVPFYDKH